VTASGAGGNVNIIGVVVSLGTVLNIMDQVYDGVSLPKVEQSQESLPHSSINIKLN